MGKQLKAFSLFILLLAVLGISACGGNKDAGKFVVSWKMTDSKGYPTTITFNFATASALASLSTEPMKKRVTVRIIRSVAWMNC